VYLGEGEVVVVS
jgi:hypothetical protein